jgi:RHS repeat-associated protein
VRTIFDDAGRLIAQCNATGNPVTLEGCARFTHDVAARIQTLIDGRGARTDLVLDASGNVVTERRYLDDGTFQDTTREFDAANRLLREFGPTGTKLREFSYDATGNILTAAGADGRTTTFTYNSVRVCNRVETQRDPTGHVSRYTYDASCNLVNATAPDGSVTAFTYTAAGQLASLQDGTGSTWRWDYDDNGFPKTVIDPFGKTLQPTINANGELTSQIDRNGRRIDYAYDALHRVIHETWNTTPPRVTTYEYSSDGTLRRASDPNSSIQFTYTSTGQVETVDTSGTPGVPALLLTYAYDKTGNITGVTDSLGASTTYSYDVLNRPTKIEQAGTNVNAKRVDFSYDAAGLLQRIRRFADLSGTAEVAASTSYEYECPGCFDRLSAIRHLRIPGGAPINDITLQRNDVSDIRQIADADGQHVYGYDLVRQLVSAQHTAAGAPPLETYAYDAVGNRLSSHLFAYGYSPVGNRLLQDDSYLYRYDDEGNLVEQTSRSTGATTQFTYDYFNRLTDVSQRDSAGAETGHSSYVYDVGDRRIGSNENGIVRRYAYDGVNPFLKFDISGQIVSRRLYAEAPDKILADDTGGATRWFLTDQLGSVRDLVANDGSVIAHYSYDSYGQPLSIDSPAVENDLRFTGREYSASTGLLYLRARYYSPRLGRFINEDPIGFGGGDVNTYRYAQNSPINLFDLSGEATFSEYSIQTRIQAFVTAAEECLGKAVFTVIGEVGVYLLFNANGIPIYPGGDANVYAGQVGPGKNGLRNFAVRFSEHVRAGKIFGETKSFAVPEEFIRKNPNALRTIEQLLMDAFGGKASLANIRNASRRLFCQ